ncbi:pyridoxamine 5'-phosphate oxidase family protein [Erysipelotrichaceae bacterium RD49]|nr:pyridoxamine 5'-phosphate oxidase family protein [Erysipelotrichaceae bacterium RD49]
MFREMRRFKQKLSDEKCLELLKTQPRGVLSMNGLNGYPYGIPMNFYYEDGHLYFHCAKQGCKLESIEQDNKVSFNVIDQGVQIEGKRGLDFNSVIVFGKIRIMEDRAKAEEMCRKFGLKYFDEEQINRDMERSFGRVNLLDLEIEHMSGKTVNES